LQDGARSADSAAAGISPGVAHSHLIMIGP
jgi:hypothetical protein